MKRFSSLIVAVSLLCLFYSQQVMGKINFNGVRAYHDLGGPYKSAVLDINKDGDLDIISAEAYDASISILFGNNDGVFDDPVYIDVGEISSDFTIGDLNNDGNPDIAVSSYNTDTASVLYGLGDGQFSNPDFYSCTDSSDLIAMGDLNNDGFADVAVGSWYGYLNVFLNNGDGTFHAAGETYVSDHLLSLAVADFNATPRMTLLSSTAGSRKTACFTEMATDRSNRPSFFPRT